MSDTGAANWQRGQLIITRGRFGITRKLSLLTVPCTAEHIITVPLIRTPPPFLLRSIAISYGRHEGSRTPPSRNWLDLIRQIGLSLPKSARFSSQRWGGGRGRGREFGNCFLDEVLRIREWWSAMRGWLARLGGEGGWFWPSVNLKAAISIAGGGLEFRRNI